MRNSLNILSSELGGKKIFHLFQQMLEFVQHYGVFGVFVGLVTIMVAFFRNKTTVYGIFKEEFKKNPWVFVLFS